MRITLLALTFNEIDGVQEILPQIEDGWVDEIIVVDGGSDDGDGGDGGLDPVQRRREPWLVQFALTEEAVWIPRVAGRLRSEKSSA